jgi:hypothetical protein
LSAKADLRSKGRGDKHRISPGLSWIDLTFLPVSDAGLVIFLALIAVVGVYVVVYAVAFLFTHLLSLGEVNRARSYYNGVDSYALDESEGTKLARKLYRTTLYFSLIVLVFAVEEGVRYFLHTGPATDEIWLFRFACLAVFTIITGVFFVRLHRWLSFKSTSKFQQTSKQIKDYRSQEHKEKQIR